MIEEEWNILRVAFGKQYGENENTWMRWKIENLTPNEVATLKEFADAWNREKLQIGDIGEENLLRNALGRVPDALVPLLSVARYVITQRELRARQSRI